MKVLRGDATKIKQRNLPKQKKVDIFISELFGNFLSMEDCARIFEKIQPLFNEKTQVFPRFGATLFLPSDYKQIKMTEGMRLSKHVLYTRGRARDAKLAENPGLLEFFDYARELKREMEFQTEFTITKKGELNSLICFIWSDMGVNPHGFDEERKKQKRGSERTQDFLNCVDLAHLMRNKPYGFGFASLDGLPTTAVNWLRALVLLDTPILVSKGDHVRVESRMSTTIEHHSHFEFQVQVADKDFKSKGFSSAVVTYEDDMNPDWIKGAFPK